MVGLAAPIVALESSRLLAIWRPHFHSPASCERVGNHGLGALPRSEPIFVCARAWTVQSLSSHSTRQNPFSKRQRRRMSAAKSACAPWGAFAAAEPSRSSLPFCAVVCGVHCRFSHPPNDQRRRPKAVLNGGCRVGGRAKRGRASEARSRRGRSPQEAVLCFVRPGCPQAAAKGRGLMGFYRKGGANVTENASRAGGKCHRVRGVNVTGKGGKCHRPVDHGEGG